MPVFSFQCVLPSSTGLWQSGEWDWELMEESSVKALLMKFKSIWPSDLCPTYRLFFCAFVSHFLPNRAKEYTVEPKLYTDDVEQLSDLYENQICNWALHILHYKPTRGMLTESWRAHPYFKTQGNPTSQHLAIDLLTDSASSFLAHVIIYIHIYKWNIYSALLCICRNCCFLPPIVCGLPRPHQRSIPLRGSWNIFIFLHFHWMIWN